MLPSVVPPLAERDTTPLLPPIVGMVEPQPLNTAMTPAASASCLKPESGVAFIEVLSNV